MSQTSPWSILKGLNDALDRVLAVVCAVLLTVMVATIFVQVLARYVFLASTPWSEEIAVYCFIWVVFLGTGLGVRDHAHLVADLLPETIGPFWDKALMVFSHGMVTVVALVFLWYGLDYAILGLTRLSFSMGFPMFYIYISLPITGTVMLLFLIERYHALWSGDAAP
jgi:TRAP-type C4-dicarboxylate transport system permease small subunit